MLALPTALQTRAGLQSNYDYPLGHVQWALMLEFMVVLVFSRHAQDSPKPFPLLCGFHILLQLNYGLMGLSVRERETELQKLH